MPAQVHPDSGDRRALGVGVGRLQIDGEDIALDRDAFFTSGWHHFEHLEMHCRLRWTDGTTPLPDGCRLVVLDTAGRGYYWAKRRDNMVSLFGRAGDPASPAARSM